MKASLKLRRRLIMILIVLMLSFASIATATFAWYIYQTSAHTTNIHMAVGTGFSLEISNRYEDGYGSATVMDEFTGVLTPVSTDRILGGFQKVLTFKWGNEGQPSVVTDLFTVSEDQDYYKTTLYLRTKGKEKLIYLSDIGFEDNDVKNPISTAIRVGLVVHERGQNQPVQGEYIFQINKQQNPQAVYNTATGKEGYVLDSTRKDGTTIPFDGLLSSDNFCDYDTENGITTIRPDSVGLFYLSGGADDGYGTPVQVDVYIWLEGCDQDCYNNLAGKTLRNVALSFACESD